MLLDDINKANVQAFKDKNTIAKDVISIIKSRAVYEKVEKRLKGEELIDADIIAIIQKLIKELEESKENYSKVNNIGEVETIIKQVEFCKQFLPQMLSKDEIKSVILSLDDKSIPSVMKYFKTNYLGKCDMKEVQEVLKSL